MKITFPHMGTLYIPIKGMLEHVGVDVVLPPKSSKRTMELGVRHSPEYACLPMKVNLGNFIEAYEEGADTILMAGGCGPCRFGYYAQVQREILEDLGYHYEWLILEAPEDITELTDKLKYLTKNRSWIDIIKAIRFGWWKARAIDALDELLLWYRPREANHGDADKVFEQIQRWVDNAKTKDDIDAAVFRGKKKFQEIKLSGREPRVSIGIVGEIYTVLEPFVAMNLEKNLGKMGVQVVRSMYLSEWINEHLFAGMLKIRSAAQAREAAKEYVKHKVGGHGMESVGNTILYSKAGLDGVIQVAPFTCMPEIVAKSILPKVSKDYDIPVLEVVVDEHSGEAGLVTRLEAFVDLLARRKNLVESV